MGQTTEIARRQADDSDNFIWRLSIADVSQDGPFSAFPGYDRTLFLLRGSGITLSHSSGDFNVLDKSLQFAEFRGDQTTMATLHDGPIQDFNVMALRSHCSAQVMACTDGGLRRLHSNAGEWLVYAVSGSPRIAFDGSTAAQIPESHLARFKSESGRVGELSGGQFVAVSIHYH